MFSELFFGGKNVFGKKFWQEIFVSKIFGGKIWREILFWNILGEKY